MKTSISKRMVPFLVIGLLLLPSVITAQNDSRAVDTSNVYQMDEIIISANRFEQDLSAVGRNVTVINRNEIENSMHLSVGGLLAEQQGVYLIGNGQTPGALQNIFMRNTNSNHTVVMIDGMRISDPSTTDNGIDLSELSLANVERIEIVRGSHSTIYGSSAIGGVINIITRDRADSRFNGTIETQQGTFGSGTYLLENRASLKYSSASGIYGNAAVSYENTNGLDATVDTVSNPNLFNRQDQDDFRKLDLAGKIGYKSDKWDLFAAYRNVDQNLDLDQGSFNDDDNAMIDFNRDLVNYRVAYSALKNLELRFNGGYSDMKRNFVDDSSRIDLTGNFDGEFIESHGDGTLLENELTARYKRDHFSVIAGTGLSRQTMNFRTFTFIRPFGFQSETNLDSLDLQENMQYGFLHTELNGSLFDSGLNSLSLILGFRALNHNRFGSHLTYEINPKLKISENSQVYMAITTGFNAPSLFRLHSPEKGFGAFTNRGNINLEPETSISYELGWRQQFGSRINLNLSLFRTKVDDVIEFIFLWNKDTPVSQLSGADFLGDTFINISEQQINGLEIGVEAFLPLNIQISGSFSFTESELSFAPDDIDESYTGGNHVQIFESGEFVNEEKEINGLTRRPSLSASLNIIYRPVESLRLGLNSRFIGDRDDIFFRSTLGPFGALGRQEVANYTLADIKVDYELNRYLQIGVKIENILDTKYTEIRGFNTRGRGIYGRLKYQF